MDYETRIACLMYAHGCVFFASSEADLPFVYNTAPEVLGAEGSFIIISKVEGSVCRSWTSASKWLGPIPYHSDGTRVKESIACKHLRQHKERRRGRKKKKLTSALMLPGLLAYVCPAGFMRDFLKGFEGVAPVCFTAASHRVIMRSPHGPQHTPEVTQRRD